MKLRNLLMVGASALLIGCSATLPVQVGGGVVKNTGKKVTAEVSHTNFLGFSPMGLSQADLVISKLQEECGGGAVTGVTTVVSTRIIIIVAFEKLEASGYCTE